MEFGTFMEFPPAMGAGGAGEAAAFDEALGLDGILAELNCGGQIPHIGVLRALRLLCEEVKPRFH